MPKKYLVLAKAGEQFVEFSGVCRNGDSEMSWRVLGWLGMLD